jgi:hypothetical protein
MLWDAVEGYRDHPQCCADLDRAVYGVLWNAVKSYKDHPRCCADLNRAAYIGSICEQLWFCVNFDFLHSTVQNWGDDT